MVITLKAKDILGFINGKYKIPYVDSVQYEKWLKVDSMVTSWILNSLSKDLAEAFLYATSAIKLWEEINERFEETNGPLLYQLKREISSFIQLNMSLIVYFTKFKKLWNELSCLRPLPSYVCDAAKTIVDIDNEDKLMQFLWTLMRTMSCQKSDSNYGSSA